MRFAFIHCPAGESWNKSAEKGKEHRHVAVERLCQIMDVSPRGYRAFCRVTDGGDGE